MLVGCFVLLPDGFYLIIQNKLWFATNERIKTTYLGPLKPGFYIRWNDLFSDKNAFSNKIWVLETVRYAEAILMFGVQACFKQSNRVKVLSTLFFSVVHFGRVAQYRDFWYSF